MKLSKVYSATATRDIHPDNRSGTRNTLELCNQAAMDGIAAIVEQEAERVRLIFRKYLEFGSMRCSDI